MLQSVTASYSAVETCAPMKRGLKFGDRKRYRLHDAVVETCAPMKRGLKCTDAAAAMQIDA